MTSRAPALVRAALLAAIAALGACATPHPGVVPADPRVTDRVSVRAPPAGWRTVAVLPFGGDPAHRRPAEALAAVRLREATRLAIVAPFALRAAYRGGGFDEASVVEDADRWARTGVAEGPADPRRDALRTLGRRLAVDGLVVGRVERGGAFADVLLVDGATGEIVIAVRRAGASAAASLGAHELAMSSVESAISDVAATLRGSPPVPPGPAAGASDAAMSSSRGDP